MPSWSGYIALGNYVAANYTDGVFTELSGAAYTRAPCTLVASRGGGAVPAAGANFGTVTGADWSWNAVAFYAVSTGGLPQLVYPLSTPATASVGTLARVHPSQIDLDSGNYSASTDRGTILPLTPGQVETTTGLPAGGIAVVLSGTRPFGP